MKPLFLTFILFALTAGAGEYYITEIDKDGEVVSSAEFDAPTSGKEEAVPAWLMVVTLFEEPTDEQWELLSQIHFPFRLNLCFISPKGDRPENLARLKELTALRELTISSFTIDDESLKVLKEVPALEHVRLQSCGKITSQGLAYLAEVKTLRALDLDLCSNIANAGFRHFRQHPRLEHLYVQNCTRVTRLVLPEIASIPNLRDFGFHNYMSSLTESDFEQISEWKNLRILDLEPCESLTRKTLDRMLQSLPKLELLVLSECVQISDSDREEIQKQYPKRSLAFL